MSHYLTGTSSVISYSASSGIASSDCSLICAASSAKGSVVVVLVLGVEVVGTTIGASR